MTRAMILAAGLGTRLRPLTEELPKPLVWLGNKPMLAHIAERLAAGGVEAAVMNTHHLAEAFGAEALAAMPLPLRVLHEPEILGTAGGVANAAEALGAGDVVVWNGDIVIDLDVRALIDAHRRGGDAATLAVAPRAAGEGTVGLDADGKVVRLRGERFGEEASGGDFVGVQVLGEALRRELPARGCLVGDAYLPLLRRAGQGSGRSATIGSALVGSSWDDIGTISAYLAANARWLASAHPGAAAFVGQGAAIADGIDITGSVIGASARVEGSGSLRGCVVWPGATARAPLERAVVTPGGRMARE